MRRLWLFLLITPLFAVPLQVSVNAKAAILMNGENGRVLFEKRAYEQTFPASTTKIATALYALSQTKGKLDQEVEVKSYALSRMSQQMKEARGFRVPPYWLQPDGTTIHLQRGEKISLEALFYGLMLQSGNDAANVIADHVSGSILNFMSDMNHFLKEIGCTNTHFSNPHGLHFPTHKTTAFDLAKMSAAALQYPEFRKIVTANEYLCPQTNKSEERQLVQRNELLKEGRFHYDGALGIKTGVHSKAGHCLVAAVEHDGRTLIAVLLGCEDGKARYRDAIALFDAAFAEKKTTRNLYNASENLFTKVVKKQTLKALLRDDIAISYYPAEEPEITAKCKWKVRSLPIIHGDIVGELQIRDEKGTVIVSQDIYSAVDLIAPKNHLIWCLIFLPVPLVLCFWKRVARNLPK